VFSMWSVPRCYKQGTRLKLSPVRESVKRKLCICEAEESPLLEAVTRKLLVKTLQAGEDLECSDL
jgi:hypothetical protein